MKKRKVIIVNLLFLLGGITGCIDSTENTIKNNPPICDISANPITGYQPLNVTFSIIANDTDGYISSWSLDVDSDGVAEFSAQGNPPTIIHYTYNKSGNYKVTLTVWDNNNSTTTKKTNIFVKNQPPEIISITANPSIGNAPLTVYFTCSVEDKDGEIVSYVWYFRDGASSNEKNPTHTYYTEGTYHVTLTVTDNDGDRTSKTINITVLPESEASYKESCRTDISFEELNSNPYAYIGERITYIGKVLQVIRIQVTSGLWETSYRVDVGIGDVIYVTIEGDLDIVEDDYIQLWGEVKGTYTYESIAGWKITLPHIEAKYIEKISGFKLKVGETAKWKDKEVTIKSAWESDYYTWIGYNGDVYYEYADTGKIFVFIDVEVKYTGIYSEYIYAGDFWLVDKQGNKYDHDSATYSIEDGLEGTTLYQNQKLSGKIVFEVPAHATGLKAQFNLESSFEPLLAEWNLNL